MKKVLFVSLALVCFTLTGFISKVNPLSQSSLSGTYGKDILQLTLNPNHSFHYVNITDVNHPINVSGNWEQKGNRIFLITDKSFPKVNSIWKIDKNKHCLKSRRGIMFIRICNCVSQ
jgi:hypothetical protein